MNIEYFVSLILLMHDFKQLCCIGAIIIYCSLLRVAITEQKKSLRKKELFIIRNLCHFNYFFYWTVCDRKSILYLSFNRTCLFFWIPNNIVIYLGWITFNIRCQIEKKKRRSKIYNSQNLKINFKIKIKSVSSSTSFIDIKKKCV